MKVRTMYAFKAAETSTTLLLTLRLGYVKHSGFAQGPHLRLHTKRCSEGWLFVFCTGTV